MYIILDQHVDMFRADNLNHYTLTQFENDSLINLLVSRRLTKL